MGPKYNTVETMPIIILHKNAVSVPPRSVPPRGLEFQFRAGVNIYIKLGWPTPVRIGSVDSLSNNVNKAN
jgi:hypothetical protein